ncbi:IS30 family transposase [Abyssisolibacter fermentans]|uniref:IS30 family transposase n=1 Tax=Abyssisolibacter fermentans TaxID=1766203 RepID=UPI00082FC367|nr:IS30 family transposase [Abyssisolibacter fermentans]
MNHNKNNNINNRKNKYLTEKERYQIEGYIKIGKIPKEIAFLIGKSVRTIQREIKRGTVELLNSDLTKKLVYCADVAHEKYLRNRCNKGANLKIGDNHKLCEYIESKIIKEKYSPDAVIGEIKANKLKFKTTICTKTLYNYIDKGIFLELTNKHLPVKYKKKRSYRKIRKVSLNNKKGRSIVERPKSVDLRNTIGHWEMDCVVGQKKDKQVLLVLTERCTRLTLIRKMKSKTQQEVGKALNSLEREYGSKFKKIFKTITMDNGNEFVNQEIIEKSCRLKSKRTTAYYAHPYSSWERGSNENANKLIRRFIPKGKKISCYTKKEIGKIQQWVNNYPRRILDYMSSSQYYEHKLSK